MWNLVDFYAGPPPGSVRFVTASVTTWRQDRAFDLITCVHGLHYVGDKLAVLAAARVLADQQRRAGGQLRRDRDPAAGWPTDGKAPHRSPAEAGFTYDGRGHRIRRDGHAMVRLPFRYLGADPAAGPNYTGQPAVHSHYEPDTSRPHRPATTS